MSRFEFVDVKGVRTRYMVAGDGPLLLLLHGGDFDYRELPSALDWCINIERLSERFRVVALDKLGAGGTDNPRREDEYTKRAVIAHAEDFLDVLGIAHVWVWGHSRGGLVALRMAVDRPDVVAGITVTNSKTAAPEDPCIPAGFYSRPYRDPYGQLGDAATYERLVEELSYDASNRFVKRFLEQKVPEFLVSHPDRPMTKTAIEYMNALRERYFFSDVVDVKYETLDLIRRELLRVPAQLVWGFNDASTPIKVGLELYQRIAMHTDVCEFYSFNHAGHLPHVEQPRAVESAVADFVSRHGLLNP